MATFETRTRKDGDVKAFRWSVADGEVLPYVNYFAAGDYYYFDNQQPVNNISEIKEGCWVVMDGAAPNERVFTMSDDAYRLMFNE
jgi:hypothetical protein